MSWLISSVLGIGQSQEFVRSRVDGREYLVQSRCLSQSSHNSQCKDKQGAADNLAKLIIKMQRLIAYLQERHPQDERTALLVSRFNPAVITEGNNRDARYTSYSVDKGEKIVFCLRNRDENNSLADLNTLTFVALHEMAHLATNDTGADISENNHSDLFWKNFKFLLETAQQPDLAIYTSQDFRRSPIEYCGMTISNSPAL